MNKKIKVYGLRLHAILRILFTGKHFVLISMSRKEFVKYLTEDGEVNARIINVGLQRYNALNIIKEISENIDFADYALEKAKNEAEIEILSNKVQ